MTDGLAISIGISSTGPSQTKATSDHSGCIAKKKKNILTVRHDSNVSMACNTILLTIYTVNSSIFYLYYIFSVG